MKKSERAIVEWIRRRMAGVAAPGLVLGAGDDCAIFRPRSGEDLVFTTDMLIEGVHFPGAEAAAGPVGRYTLLRGLSDIAAMGAGPRFCLLSLALPEWAGGGWIESYLRGLLSFGVPLAGGDLSHAERLAADIVVCGGVPKGRALRRDTAAAGDAIYVSGELGGAAANAYAYRAEPRLELGRFLRGRATACMDLSDGLSLDLQRLAEASGLAAEIAAPPAARGASLQQALDGGDDYELLFTARPDTRIPKRRSGLRLTRIGAMRKGKPGAVNLDGRPLAPRGYRHFAPGSPGRNRTFQTAPPAPG